jgi:UDP-N-acetyl-D-mannosaminuronate dehydrogenase
MKPRVLVVGLGEIGRPLMELLGQAYEVHGKDLEPLALDRADVLHVCYPYQIDNFVGTTVEYIEQYRPKLVIINSTVVPGTTRRISQQAKMPIVYSPIRGKHARMKEDLMRYTKFVAGTDPQATEQAVVHFEKAGFKVGLMSSCEALELAKLLETTYFGLLIAWAQEMERFCREVGADYDEVMQFTKEIDFLPPVIFQPGYIGGHCVIPNTFLLDQVRRSPFVEAIRTSNERKAEEWQRMGKPLDVRLSPKPKK